MPAGRPILIADDFADDVAVLKYALRRAAILNPVQVVQSGEAAVSYLNGEGVHEDRALYPFPVLLLLDVKMPGRSGFDVLTWLRQTPKLKPPGVVMVTGAGVLTDIRKAYELGSDSFLTKPVSVEDMLNTLRGLRGLEMRDGPEGYLVVGRGEF